MDLQRIRVFLLFAIGLVGVMLFTAWQKEHQPAPSAHTLSTETSTSHTDLPSLPTTTGNVPAFSPSLPESMPAHDLDVERYITIDTPVLRAKIDKKGGDVVFAALPQYPQTLAEDSEPFVLLDQTQERYYIAQSGLIGAFAPDSETEGRGWYEQESLKYNEDGTVSLVLRWMKETGVSVRKHFDFSPDDYVIAVRYELSNASDAPWQVSPYYQLKKTPVAKPKKGLIGMQTFQGAAFSTPDKPYQKFSFDKMKSKPLYQEVTGGWAAMVEHYFLGAWIPAADQQSTYYTRADEKNYYIGFVSAPLQLMPGDTESINARLYLGPEITEDLKAIAPGLDLTVDYGVLWPISQALFWLLKNIHALVLNWGVAIILVTLLIKLAFYRLSAASYRSMGNMRRIQPELTRLKETCGEDKQRFSQEMMALYRREKINPLGGCLPILVQIPVFIALYYVLLESVELRQAPFIFWIKDLSVHDPFYVLPILMGASMLAQQKLNPAPPDPVQARVMMLMPIVFTVLFLQFPAGLVLYWFVNNLLSMTQQWVITRRIEKGMA